MPKMIVENVITTEPCSYGCGSIAKFKNKSGKLSCSESSTQCKAVKLKNSRGLKKANSSGKRNAKLIYAHLSDETKLRMSWNKEKNNADFSYDGKGSHKKVLIKDRGHRCENCFLTEWLCEPIPLELEHKDGNNRNNIKDNLLLLCPNCHAKTKFYRGRNINTGKIKVSDEEILIQLAKGIPVRQVLINVGLTPKGGNYDRVNKLKFLAPLAQMEEATDLSSV